MCKKCSFPLGHTYNEKYSLHTGFNVSGFIDVLCFCLGETKSVQKGSLSPAGFHKIKIMHVQKIAKIWHAVLCFLIGSCSAYHWHLFLWGPLLRRLPDWGPTAGLASPWHSPEVWHAYRCRCERPAASEIPNRPSQVGYHGTVEGAPMRTELHCINHQSGKKMQKLI